MFRARFVFLMLALLLVLSVGGTVLAAEVDCDSVYCFTSQDFAQGDLPLAGICITQLPEPQSGTVMLGTRILRPGDILTAEQLAQMTFAPLRTQEDAQAQVTYLPIYEDRVEKSTTMTISIRGKEDKSPVAQDSSLETYKNLPNKGSLKASDPEGDALTFTLVRNPKRGEVTINTDGSFTYTPKKNKVGVDSFTFTAADPAGNVSREATVTIQILKPTDAKQYTDTIGLDCRFAAEWMRNTGLFVGEKVSGQDCFYPEKTVSRGEFLAMVVQILDIPLEDAAYTAIPEDTPDWLKPYLAAAMRSGLLAGLPQTETGSFAADQPVTGAEVAVMLQNALDLSVTKEVLAAEQQQSPSSDEEIPVWAAASVTVLRENGIRLDANAPVTRGLIAQVLYQTKQLSVYAPGMAVFRMQQS